MKRRLTLSRIEWRQMSGVERTLLWPRLTQAERRKLLDPRDLTPQLKGLEGWRVEVVDQYGEARRFNVGISWGWEPIHLELPNQRSTKGRPADRLYRKVSPLRRLTPPRKQP